MFEGSDYEEVEDAAEEEVDKEDVGGGVVGESERVEEK